MMVGDPTTASTGSGRSDLVLWAVAGGFALLVAASGVAPTGTRWFDFVALSVGAALLIRVAAVGPWWARTGAAGLAAAIALDPVGASFGIVGLVVGALAPDDEPSEPSGAFGRLRGALGRRPELVGVVVAGCGFNALARMDFGNDSGLSTLVGCLVSIGLAWCSRNRSNRFDRRRLRRVALAVGAYALFALLAAGLAGLGVRDDAREATAAARAGAKALEAGDDTAAADHIDDTAAALRRTEQGLGGLLAFPARFVPGLAQNVSAARSLAGAGADLTSEVGGALDDVDLDGLSVSGGAIDLDLIEEAKDPVDRVHASFTRFAETFEEAQSPWLVPPFGRRLSDYDDEVSDGALQMNTLVDAVDLVPEMLGRDAPRRYLVLLTTPTEARGLGGFPGSWATIEVTNGRVEVSEVARIDELNDATVYADCSACDAEMLQRYGRFGLTTAPGRLSGPDSWSQLTFPVSFPAIADAATRLFPQATGSTIDGVIVMDPFVMETLASYGDPIEISALDDPIPADGVAEFILADQYLLPGGRVERLIALAELSSGALDGLLAGSLPEPAALLDDMGPLVEERRLLFWTTDPDEQGLLDELGLLGDLPALDPRDGGFSFSTNNAAASKIDRFIERETVVTEVRRDGERFLRAEVTIRNTAPSTGLPEYVIGNLIGIPDGAHRLVVSFFGPSEPVLTTMDGVDQTIVALPEDGWVATEVIAEFASGEERVFVLEYALGPNGSDSFEPTLWEQPTAVRTP